MNSTTKINDICKVSANDESALILINKLCDTHLIGSLIHTYPEWATNSDAIIYDVCPYPIVVQTAIVGCFWYSQIDSVICNLPENWRQCSHRGTDVRGVVDSRIIFKSNEIRRLHTFISDCTSQLLEV
jgi:hypothetical protein